MKNILIVDDEVSMRNLFSNLLEDEGYKTSCCKNGKIALDFYTDNWKDVDLVLLDIMMPVMGGRECFIKMKLVNPDIKVIVITSCPIEMAQEIVDDGASGFLSKPPDLDKVVEKVKEVII